MFFGSVSPAGYTLCCKKETCQGTSESFTEVNEHVRVAYENRVRDDGLRLGRRGGGVVVVRIVPLSRECAGGSVGGGPVTQRGSTGLECSHSTF